MSTAMGAPTSVTGQLPLAFEHRTSLDGADFLVADCNREAVAWLDRWPDWPAPTLIVHGPPGCGKSHLAAVFLSRTGGVAISASRLAEVPASELVGGLAAGVLDDADASLAAVGDAPLFHLYNAARDSGARLLLTAAAPPAHWRITLADLRSRLNAATQVGIGAPDDALLQAVMVKLFADRQLRVDPEVVPYAASRIERSFEAVRGLVAEIDAHALQKRRNITVRLVGELLDQGRAGRR